jgi:dephospho-CoA kinase
MTGYRLGLTGSIGMGKSTTATMFAEEGLPVWDADATVARLYASGGAAVAPLAAAFPGAIEDGAISRPRLRAMIARDPTVLDRVQAIVHPLVAADRGAFLRQHSGELVLLDIPLLFESGASALCDGIVTVTAPPEIQRARVLARGQMTEAEFELILSRQMPDAEKRARATWVIETTTLDSARAAVRQILSEIRRKLADA